MRAVPVKEYKAEKMFYTMGEITEMFDVKASLVRFWCQRFDILKPQKNKKGNRLFTPEDVRNLETIYHLVRERGMTLAGVDKYLKTNRSEAERDSELMHRLQTVRDLLIEIREELKEGADDETEILIEEEIIESEPVEIVVEEEIVEEVVLPGEIEEEEEEEDLFDAELSEPFTAQSLFEEEGPTESEEDSEPTPFDAQQSLF